MKWAEVIARPEWATFDAEQQAYARERWVDKFAVPEARKAGFTEEEIGPLREKAITEFDNGQGIVTSFLSSAGRGVAGTVSGVVGGIGAVTGDDSLRQAADEMDAAVADALPVNPSLTKTNFVGGALGQAGGVMLTAGAGGALAKGLSGVRAVAAGAEAAAMTSGVLSGARQGANDADQYGMTGAKYAARVALGGATEYFTEKLPFGLATETAAAKKLLGAGVKTPSRALTFGGGVVTESLEEGASQIAGNAANIALAAEDVQTPTLFTGVAGAMAGGAIGGAGFGVVNLAVGANGQPADPGSPAPLPPPASFTQPNARPSEAPKIPMGKLSLNGEAFVFDGATWQRPATNEELAAELGLLLRPLDADDVAEGATIAALTAAAQSAIRRRAAEKAASQKDTETATPRTEEPKLPVDEGVPAVPLTTPEASGGTPPIPGLPPPAGMQWDASGNAVPIVVAPESTPEVVEGKPIDEEWTAFSAESGTLGIPRAEMPQVKGENRGALANFLTARGVEQVKEEVLPGTLKPTQAEFSPAKVEKAKGFEKSKRRALFVSQDDHVVDGHHQWLADLETPDDPIEVVRLKAPIRDLIALVNEFPSSEKSGGSGETGNAQPLTAPVQTPAGPVAIGSLRPGDYILAVDGEAQQVTGTFPQGMRPVFLVTLGDGRSVPATADHLWLARKAGLDPEVVTTAHLLQGLEAGESWHLPVMEES